MDMEMLWKKTCALLTQEMSFVSYSTWIDGNMEPVAIEGESLLICVKMDSMRPMILNKYGKTIDRCLTEAGGTPMKALLMSRSEMEEKNRQMKVAPKTDDEDPRLNPKYTFENFVVGDANRFAYAACLAVAENPAEAYNPLFIYGGVGFGKTHLMQAIGNLIHQESPKMVISYMTSEAFTNELISAIQQKKTYELREKLRKTDVLMVDDIQFIAGRESTQQEFFNLFNELHNAGKQIILTSDKPPKEIQRLEERLCSRFEWGLVVDVQRPDMETRLAILHQKCKQENYVMPEEVLELIAGKIDSNVRELEGCLRRLKAFSDLRKEPVTLELCNIALRDFFDQQRHRQITAELIMQNVSDYFGLTIGDLTGPTRRRDVTVPRQIAMYLTREMTGMSLPQIGAVFGGRDHTTVLHSCKTVEANLKNNPSFEHVLKDVKNRVKRS